MGSLKNAVLRLGGLSITAGGIAVTGRIGIILVLVLIIMVFALIAILALTGTFGSDRHQLGAQVVLALLLGRTPPQQTVSPPGKPTPRPRTRRAAGSAPSQPGP